MDIKTFKSVIKAKKGATPISFLLLAGHHYTDAALSLWGHPTQGKEFAVASIVTVAQNNGIGNNLQNDYEHSAKKEGPPRCWMRYGGHIWGLGCTTNDGWGTEIAGILARAGGNAKFDAVTVHVTTDNIYAFYDEKSGGRVGAFMRPMGQPDVKSSRWSSIENWSIWSTIDGSI